MPQTEEISSGLEIITIAKKIDRVFTQVPVQITRVFTGVPEISNAVSQE